MYPHTYQQRDDGSGRRLLHTLSQNASIYTTGAARRPNIKALHLVRHPCVSTTPPSGTPPE